MTPLLRPLGILFLCLTLFLTACGGGGSNYGNEPSPAFNIIAWVDGHAVAGLEAWPGTAQSLQLPVNHTFELDSSGDVNWRVIVNGAEVPPVGNDIFVGSVTIQELATSRRRFVANTFSEHPLTAPVQVTLLATSVYDPGQTARIDVIITN